MPVEAAQRGFAQVQAQFAEAVHARAEAAATLRRLTAECAEAQEEIARARGRLGLLRWFSRCRPLPG